MEVFPTLHLEGDCKVYMEDDRVDRVVNDKSKRSAEGLHKL